MMSTETAATVAKASRGSGPQTAQARKASAAAATTSGTNQPATWSARRWIGARDRCAPTTMRTICASTVSCRPVGAHFFGTAKRSSVPPTTRAPGPFGTGTASPVTRLSSTLEVPSSTSPSSGTLPPGRTRSRSPTAMAASASVVFPARRIEAARGRRRQVQQGGWHRRCGRGHAQFEDLADQHQHDDDRRGFEIDPDRTVMAAELVREGAGARVASTLKAQAMPVPARSA